MKKISTKKAEFNDYRFAGLDWNQISNEYVSMNRVGNDSIVVRVGDSHLLQTKYGYAFILDRHHVVFLKEWQVSRNFYGNEVLLQKKYFTPKEWGNFDEFENNKERLAYEHYMEAAKAQDELVNDEGIRINRVRWSI